MSPFVSIMRRAFLAAVAPTVFLATQALGSAFRGNAAAQGRRSIDILEDVERALGSGLRGAAESRAAQLEDAMRPIFASLPKAEDGRLPWTGVRYLLHRVFVERHAWQVHGIADNGEGWSSASPSQAFVEHAGDEAVQIFEKRLSSQGLTLHEAAVFAATLEGLVHEEVVERLHAAYHLVGSSMHEDAADEDEIELVLDVYMLMYVRNLDHAEVTEDQILELLENYRPSNWNATKQWMRKVRKEVVSADPDARGAFGTTVRAVEEAMDRYGRWQNYECDAMKTDLLKIERGGSGRVPLQDFYRAALNGQHLFTEAKEYLRELGALDESIPSRPSVIIANYVNAPSNCLAGSRFYSVCCLNECEALLKPLEEHIGAPAATAGRIVELVEQLASPTVVAPRKLPALLVARLEEIAAHHSGRVPLHGRLFAQWMHHAYPRECPFPHLSGTTTPMRGREWSKKTGEHFLANASTMEQHIEECSWGEQASDVFDDAAPAMHWSSEEELQIHMPSQKSSKRSFGRMRGFMLLAAASSMTAGMLFTARRSQRELDGRLAHKAFV